MFKLKNISKNLVVQNATDFIERPFLHPKEKDVSTTDFFWWMIDGDCIDMIYGVRTLPGHNYMAFKVKYSWEAEAGSEIIYKPELKLLKRIWDIGHHDMCKAVEWYVQYSKDCNRQFNTKDNYEENVHCYKWYLNTILGRNRE